MALISISKSHSNAALKMRWMRLTGIDCSIQHANHDQQARQQASRHKANHTSTYQQVLRL